MPVPIQYANLRAGETIELELKHPNETLRPLRFVFDDRLTLAVLSFVIGVRAQWTDCAFTPAVLRLMNASFDPWPTCLLAKVRIENTGVAPIGVHGVLECAAIER